MAGPRAGPTPLLRPKPARTGGRLPVDDELFSEETALFLMRFGVQATAEKHCVSERTLRRQFERHGIGIEEHLAKIRRALVPRLLAGRTPLNHVAQQLGFSTPKTLSRFIHREFGVTLTELRRDYRRRERE